MTERKKIIASTTPKGTLKFPKLEAPDFGTNDFPYPGGRYFTKLVMSADDLRTRAFLEALRPHHDAAIAAANNEFSKLKFEARQKLGSIRANNFFTTLCDRDTKEPTGDIEFNFKMTASGVRNDGSRWSTKPVIFDAKCTRMTKVPEILSGSIGRVAFEIAPYFIPATGAAGLSMKLKAVQILKLRSGVQHSAELYGFHSEAA